VAATQKRIDDLTAQSDGDVVDAFMNPPADTALDAMGAASAGDASVKASIVGMRRRSSAGWRAMPPATASTTCRASPGTGAPTARSTRLTDPAAWLH
jgi:hypothetical protein